MLSINLKPPVERPQAEIRCLDVIPNGDVTLRWTPPVAPAGWVSGYTIEHSGSVSGPFVTIGNLTNASATSYTHTGAGANLSDAFYKVSAHYTQQLAGLIAPSITARAIQVTVATGVPKAKKVFLSWQPTLTNLSKGYTGLYEVYRESSPGQWILIKTVSALTCTDTATYQGQTLRYKVLTANTYSDSTLGITPCTSSSNIASVFLNPVEEQDSPAADIRVFPNPGNGIFTLDPGSLSGFSSLRVFDLQGKLVLNGNPVLTSGEPLDLDLRILTPGTYFLNIECGENCFATRIMIE
ncbi:MAG TPA: T9SS type A sorting domain-containing protein [Bacteroidales bacterium]|nr:T9SS type A sorting domain-containing protein [Bacteroidales bacterium]HRZ50075.1 T9SS type A sorting domain-containing protein [Bacteroidales bacterium]